MENIGYVSHNEATGVGFEKHIPTYFERIVTEWVLRRLVHNKRWLEIARKRLYA